LSAHFVDGVLSARPLAVVVIDDLIAAAPASARKPIGDTDADVAAGSVVSTARAAAVVTVAGPLDALNDVTAAAQCLKRPSGIVVEPTTHWPDDSDGTAAAASAVGLHKPHSHSISSPACKQAGGCLRLLKRVCPLSTAHCPPHNPCPNLSGEPEAVPLSVPLALRAYYEMNRRWRSGWAWLCSVLRRRRLLSLLVAALMLLAVVTLCLPHALACIGGTKPWPMP
jgi:hypothetical protein